MTTLENRPNTALLVVDVQNGVVEGAHERDAVVANVGSLVEKARRERVPVVWVQHSDEELARGSDDWRIVPELDPGDAEPLVEKSYGDSFEDTTLETVLSGLGVGRLVVVGAADRCVHPLDAPRRVRPGLRRDPGQRRPHHGGPDGMGSAAAGPGHRAHEPVLDLPDGAGTDGRDGRDQGRRLRAVVAAPEGSHRSRGVETVDGATVSVAIVTSRIEAELIVGMLRSNGLSAAVSADDAGGLDPQLQAQGVRVLVAPSDEASARRLIAEANDPPQ